ncbi:hypothetical protein [Microbacterium memoriense]|uniref:Uncharacterized protein n=1 Tax=Microbacterium memoriense TaxID=2978350 RepID=A0ABT2PDF1_9MICO|nr:hypothetical protein [Microbacterium memoriense]MCT9002641.1 hypothetical protein [Microbacterium memoriense]
MRWTLAAVGAVVAVGLVAAAILFFTPPTPPSGAAATTATASAAPTAAGPRPDATPVDGSEVQPPADQSAPSDRLPPLPMPTPLITAPLPETSSARGSLVDGFPSTVAGPAPGADILESSIASADTVMQVTLTARTDATQDEVIAHYRSTWSALGLSDAGGEAPLAYTDQFSSATLSFTPGSGTGTVYVVFATLRTE